MSRYCEEFVTKVWKFEEVPRYLEIAKSDGLCADRCLLLVKIFYLSLGASFNRDKHLFKIGREMSKQHLHFCYKNKPD